MPGCDFHSDRGGRYASAARRRRLTTHGFLGSMSRPGNSYDNAKAERFMEMLKVEAVHLTGYDTREEVDAGLPRFIQEVDNTRRLHSALGYLSPDEVEARNMPAPVKTAA